MLAQYCFDALAQAWPNDAMPWAMPSVHKLLCHTYMYMLYRILYVIRNYA